MVSPDLLPTRSNLKHGMTTYKRSNTLPSGEERKCPKCHKMVVPRYATENYGVMGWAVCPRCNTNRHKTDWDGRNDGGMGR